jgi:hypothetical protein
LATTWCRAGGAAPAQVDELVAGAHEERRRRLLDGDANDPLVVLAQLVGQRAEVAVARGDHEGVDVLARVTQLERVDHQPHVRPVLPGARGRRDVHQLDPELVQVGLGVAEARPVAIRPPEDDLALLQQPLHRRAQVEGGDGDARVGHQIFEVDEQRNPPLGSRCHRRILAHTAC